jgi:hypothetical protein
MLDFYGDFEQPVEKETDLWEKIFGENSQKNSRSSEFFYKREFQDHLEALNSSSIGRFLGEGAKKLEIKIEYNSEMSENSDGTYIRMRGFRRQGKIEYGDHMNALILGHEIRHVWQHMSLSSGVQNPISPEEQILLDRFIEADGRAVEFGLTIQIAHEMTLNHEYAHNLLACFDGYEKEICEYSIKKIEELGQRPDLLKQAMRNVFDWWVAHSPTAPDVYDQGTEESLKMGTKNTFYKAVFDLVNKGFSPRPCYIRSGIDAAYVENLVEELGSLGSIMGGNYLTESDGLSFTDEFYTRPCQYRLEREAQKFAFSS